MQKTLALNRWQKWQLFTLGKLKQEGRTLPCSTSAGNVLINFLPNSKGQKHIRRANKHACQKRTPLSYFSICWELGDPGKCPQHIVGVWSKFLESETAETSISDVWNYLTYPFFKHIWFPGKRRWFIQQTERNHSAVYSNPSGLSCDFTVLTAYARGWLNTSGLPISQS